MFFRVIRPLCAHDGNHPDGIDKQSGGCGTQTCFDAALVRASFKPWTEYAQFIRSGITRRSQTPVDFHDHSLLNARLADDKADGPFVDYLHALYADKPPDLIVAIGAPAANFVQRYRESIFPGVPMLLTVLEARRDGTGNCSDARRN